MLKKIDPHLKEYWTMSSRETLHNKAMDLDSILDFDYSDYDIFCIVRNPYDRLISLYNFSEKDFLHTNYINQYQFVFDKTYEKLLVKTIIRYENLESELSAFLHL